MYKPISTISAAALLIIPGKIGRRRLLTQNTPIFLTRSGELYSVPACPAARGLGCGSAAKPSCDSSKKKKTIPGSWLESRREPNTRDCLETGTMPTHVPRRFDLWRRTAAYRARTARGASEIRGEGLHIREDGIAETKWTAQ